MICDCLLPPVDAGNRLTPCISPKAFIHRTDRQTYYNRSVRRKRSFSASIQVPRGVHTRPTLYMPKKIETWNEQSQQAAPFIPDTLVCLSIHHTEPNNQRHTKGSGAYRHDTATDTHVGAQSFPYPCAFPKDAGDSVEVLKFQISIHAFLLRAGEDRRAQRLAVRD